MSKPQNTVHVRSCATGLCAQGSRKAGVASVCLAGGDGAEVGAAGEEKVERGSWGPGGDHALIQVK